MSEKVHIKAEFPKTEFDKYATSGVTQPVITCSKLTIKTQEQGMKYVQS